MGDGFRRMLLVFILDLFKQKSHSQVPFLVAGRGFEPLTFGL